MKTLHTDAAPQAIGPYSQGQAVNGFLFCSGQIALDPATGEVVGKDIVSQTKQVLKNIDALLKASGLSASNVVKTTCFLKNIEDFTTFNEVYGTYFTEHKPARSAVEVARLPKDVLVEIEIIAAE
ncbi:RidA family protein [Enterococcus nangangensis]|uniref:RidA family protein n=1 Tax=Enterococcus nangangensis TaxID=2559926 RepID=UPI0010F5FD78|nr:RidA family protein [Enterococcus nangangensis]